MRRGVYSETERRAFLLGNLSDGEPPEKRLMNTPEIRVSRRGKYGWVAQITDGSATSVIVDGMDELAVRTLAESIRAFLLARQATPRIPVAVGAGRRSA